MQVINEGKKPIKAWIDGVSLEDEAKQQLINLSTLPFIFKHIAVMPDAHAGKGSTVGTVIATKGAIIPAAVGVDIGCFIGETKIPLLNGSQRSLESLYKQTKGKNDFWVYSIDEKSLSIVPGKAKCIKTRKKADLVKVTISGGDEIICTPDHLFMLVDGSYKEAKDLIFNESLMPLYRSWQTRDGYESVSNGKNNSKMLHKLVYSHFKKIKKGNIIHHIDHNHFNNTPENLISMSASKHSKLHRSIKSKNKHWQSPKFEEKRIEAIRNLAKTPEGYKYMAEKGRKNIIKYMENNPEHFKKSVAGNGKRGKKYLVKYNKSDKGRLKSKEVSQRLYPCKKCDKKFIGGFRVANHMKVEHSYNHKVISVEKVSYKHDVYCLQVEKYHNFAISAGVFVHNCGMQAVKLPFKIDMLKDLSKLRSSIERSIPVGFNQHKDTDHLISHLIKYMADSRPSDSIAHDDKLFKKSLCQLGTLGGGNHFIEICQDENNDAWVMLHSGSRNIGKTLAEIHINKAKNLMKEYFISLPDPDLAYLAQNTPEFKSYIDDLLWAQQYAKQNRKEMMDLVLKDISYHVYGENMYFDLDAIDCHHNYTQMENHFGSNIWVTRKGAVSAKEGEFGIIPGSMGAKSFIVKGKGNPESFCSCSHGAGRAMSRTKARALFTIEDQIKATEGIECRKDEAVIDEIPMAYKDVEAVMMAQSDLVDIVHTLKQVICIKG